MQPGDQCVWFLIKLPGVYQFAVQYTGDDPDSKLPVDVTGHF